MTQIDRINGLVGSIAVKAPCRVATTANITLSGAQTIDGVAVVADDRVLVKDQTTGSENGIYVASSTAWARATDWNGARDIVQGTQVIASNGTVGAGTYEVSTANPITIGTTSVSFSSVVTAAAASAVAAAASAAAAAASAASVELPSMTGEALGMLRANAGETALEYRTPAEVLSDIGAQASDADTAKTDVAQDWTAQQVITEATLTDGANIAWDLDAAQEATVTLDGNRTLDNPTNQNAGGWYHLRVVQDAVTGSRTLAYGTAYKFGDAGAPTLSTAVDSEDVLAFRSNGTYMQYMGAALGVQA